MIRPLRRLHRRMIGIVIVTLALAALLAITHRAPDARMDSLPASLLPEPGPSASYLPESSPGPAGRSTP